MTSPAYQTKSTNQKLFNRVVRHLRKQGKRAMSMIREEEACAYRGSGGTTCAVGCLISDKYYQPDFEGGSVLGCKDIQKAVKKSVRLRFQDNTVRLLSALQDTHDNYFPGEKFEWRLQDIAEAYELTYTPPKGTA